MKSTARTLPSGLDAHLQPTGHREDIPVPELLLPLVRRTAPKEVDQQPCSWEGTEKEQKPQKAEVEAEEEEAAEDAMLREP